MESWEVKAKDGQQIYVDMHTTHACFCRWHTLIHTNRHVYAGKATAATGQTVQ